MTVDPSKHRILLVGPRVVHLKPFFERRRYKVVATQKGVEGMSALDAEPRDIVILELNLGDLTATEFLMAARQAHANASFLLLDDASKAGQIVKALQAGLDGYLPTPPDEDRLFFEVERHLRHASAALHASANAFNEQSGNTQVTLRPEELTKVQTQLADRESQLLEMGVHSEMLQQELSKAREDVKKLATLRQALVGMLDGELDADQAARLKERLALATVLETENETLREELAGSKNVRRELQDQIEQLKRRNTELDSRLKAKVGDSLEGPALKDKANELEADNMVMAGRIAELEESLDAARADLGALELRSGAEREEREELVRQLQVIKAEHSERVSEQQQLMKKHAAELGRLREEREAELARLKQEHEDEISSERTEREILVASLREEHENTVKKLESDAAIERVSLESRIADAGQSRDLEQRVAELTAALDAASVEKDQAVEKALDIELVLDEHKTKIDFLEGEVKKAQERVHKAESDFKKEKLRLIEEKEQAATGSHESFEKLQRFIDDNAALKKANAELEAMRASLEERARKGDEAAQRSEGELKQAAVIRAEAIQQRDTAEGARRAIEDKLANVERQLGDQIASLERRLDEERAKLSAAERALADAGQAVNRLADANAARDTAEREATRLQDRIVELEVSLASLKANLEEAKKSAGATDAASGELKGRVGDLEKALAERERTIADRDKTIADRDLALADQKAELAEKLASKEAALAEAADRAAHIEAQAAQQRSALTDQYEARLREALAGSPAATNDIVVERDAYRTRLAETEAWVQQAQLHLEALRVERDQLAAQATALGNDSQARAVESQELYTQLAAAKAQVEQLVSRAAGVEQELLLTRQQLQQQQRQPAGPDPAAFAQIQEELKVLRVQLQQAQRTGLPEELEPLRWTLTAAIDALTALEGREPAVGAHLRNLRLLASTLQRLSPSG